MSTLPITVKLENRGTWLIMPRSQEAVMALRNSSFHITELNEDTTEKWAVVTRYPLYLQPDLLLTVPNVLAAERCKGQDKTPTAQV